MLYIFMLATQLTGALILLLNSIKCGKKAVIKNCFPGSNFVERDKNNNCVIPKEKLQKSAHEIYMNIVAFADLVIGYVLCAVAPDSTSECAVFGVLVVTAVLLAVEYNGSRCVACVVYAKDEKVPYSDLEKNEVDTVLTGSDFEEMWNAPSKGE